MCGPRRRCTCFLVTLQSAQGTDTDVAQKIQYLYCPNTIARTGWLRDSERDLDSDTLKYVLQEPIALSVQVMKVASTHR
ncbi:hypothetical protein BKA69DRAFT_1065387 [Paraphysoderma sedebokerense]|nr:hypothetical protein BKA69DRAFT_1065387 [Paraphysoderma sedebokerense]